MTRVRASLLSSFLLAVLPAAGLPWGQDGHLLVLRLALESLPAAVRASYAGMEGDLERAALEPDKLSAVPLEACKHWIDVEKLDPQVLGPLRDALAKHFGNEGYADEDARGFTTSLEKTVFARDPPPWSATRLAPVWAGLPPTLEAFRARYGRMEFITGVVVYQPLIYTRALARALAAGDRRRIVHAAGSLAHYVADLHVPVHVTSDYRGQYSGNPLFEDPEHGDVHVRFETGYVKADLAVLERMVRAKLTDPPAAMAPAAITPRAIAAAERAYGLLSSVLSTDRAVARRHDPRRDWEGYLAGVRPAFSAIAGAQLAAATSLLADCLATAAFGERLAPPASSSMMNSP